MVFGRSFDLPLVFFDLRLFLIARQSCTMITRWICREMLHTWTDFIFAFPHGLKTGYFKEIREVGIQYVADLFKMSHTMFFEHMMPLVAVEHIMPLKIVSQN